MKTRSFESHGVSFKTKPGAKDSLAICPFCQSIHNGSQKEGKFSVEIETGVWQCWHCKRKGNVQTFLEQIHEHWLAQTSEVEYEALAAVRPGLHAEDFQLQKLAYNQLTDRWLLPCYTRRNTLANLYTYQPGAHAFCTAGMGHGLFGMESIQAGKPIYMVEGPWSRMAMLRLMKAAKVKGSVVGVPGSVFKQDWCDLFIGQTLYLTFDNDSAGGEESERALQFLTTHSNGKPKNIYRIHWPSTAPAKYDPRELIHFELDTSNHKPASVWADFGRLFVPATYSGSDVEEPVEEEPLPTVKSFKALLKHFTEHIHLNDNMEDGIAVTLAAAISCQLPGNPEWLFLVGAPGSGKTLLLEAFSRYKGAVYRSSIRSTELISGWLTDDGSDPSLIPKIQGKILVLKDYTEVLAMNAADQDILYGVLRGAYDGRAERHFANGLERVYNHCWFGMVAGVTDDIKAHNRASLGERFIRFQWVEAESYDRSTHITAAIRGYANQVATERFLAGVVAGFLSEFDLTDAKLPTIEPWFETRIVALVQILAHLRAHVNTGFHGELTHRPVVEIGTRPAVQFCKLAQCLCLILGKKRIDMKVYSIIEKIFKDTCESWSHDIFNCLLKHSPDPVTKEVIEQEARIPSTTCFRRLEVMESLGTITRGRIAAIVPGRPAYGWVLSDPIQELVKQAKMEPQHKDFSNGVVKKSSKPLQKKAR